MTGGLPEMFDLGGRVALVTGAAGQLGAAFAEALHAAGARLALADLDPTGAEKVRDALDAEGTTAVALQADVSDADAVGAMVRETVERLGSVDVLVNNAGIACFTPFERRTVEEFQRVLDVNLKGAFLCARAAAGEMERRGGGAIVNIASIYGVVGADPRIYGESGRNSSEVYAASKGGVIAMTRYLATYLAPRNIRVNCLSPGGVFNHQDPFFVEKYCERTPMGRMATVEDLKGAIVFLASDASRYVTGQNLVVDGGWTAW